MIKSIKLDGKTNYLVDNDTGKIVHRYEDDRNLSLILTLEDSVLEISGDNIFRQFDDQIIVQHNDDRYMIDDGYYNTLIKSGYIVFEKYDEENINPDDKKEGLDIRDKLIYNVRDILKKFNYEYTGWFFGDTFETSGHKTIFKLNSPDDEYSYIFVIDTINNMVNKNQGRKENNLSFYPFKKCMDRYGTLYLSVFCQKNKEIEKNSPKKKYEVPDTVIRDLIKSLNESFAGSYHYVSNQVKRRVVYCKGL